MYGIKRNCFGKICILKNDSFKFIDKEKAENCCKKLSYKNKYIVYNVVPIKD